MKYDSVSRAYREGPKWMREYIKRAIIYYGRKANLGLTGHNACPSELSEFAAFLQKHWDSLSEYRRKKLKELPW